MPGVPSGGHGRASPPRAPTSLSSNRRWSSGDDRHASRIRRCASQGSYGCTTPPSSSRRAATAGPSSSSKASFDGKRVHRRTRSADRRFEVSGSVSASSSRSGVGSASSPTKGHATGIAGSRGGTGTLLGRGLRMVGATSRRSASDSGSVVRLGSEHGLAPWEDDVDVGVVAGGGGGGEGAPRGRRASSGCVSNGGGQARRHRRRASAPEDGSSDSGNRRSRGIRGDRSENEGVDGGTESVEERLNRRNGSATGGGPERSKEVPRASPGSERRGGLSAGIAGSASSRESPGFPKTREGVRKGGASSVSSGRSSSSPVPSGSGLPPLASSTSTSAVIASPPLVRAESTQPQRSPGSPAKARWPWVSVSTGSSPLLGIEGTLASESDMGASETSDWDQVSRLPRVCCINPVCLFCTVHI